MRSTVRDAYRRYPFIANSVSGFSIFAAGDVIAQTYESSREAADEAVDAPPLHDAPFVAPSAAVTASITPPLASSSSFSSKHTTSAAAPHDDLTSPVAGGFPIIASITTPAAVAATISLTDHVDWGRAARHGCLGIVLSGAGLYGWYRVVERLSPGHSVPAVAGKVLLDQLMWAPPCLSFQLACSAAGAGKRGPGIWEDVKGKFTTAYRADWATWPFVNTVAFSLVPMHVRPVFIGCFNVAFQVFMSNLGHQSLPGHQSLSATLSDATAIASATVCAPAAADEEQEQEYVHTYEYNGTELTGLMADSIDRGGRRENDRGKER